MPCYHPLEGYRARVVNQKTGKRGVVFNVQEGFRDLPVQVPCGRCIGCRLEKSRQWAVRMMHEASLHEFNCFITLTYDEKHLPRFASLDKRAFPKFIKRLRKAVWPLRFSYFHAGEYGGTFGRPHYHACIFGYDFPDKVVWTVRNGHTVWRSALLESCWKFGLSEVGSLTFESAAYVARYVVAKKLGKEAESAYDVVDVSSGEVVGRREPEYATMSRRPAIASNWFKQYHQDVYPSDQVIARGSPSKPPRYYDKMLAGDLGPGMQGPSEAHVDSRVSRAIQLARKIARNPAEETYERLEVREKVAQARLTIYSEV